MFYQKDAQATDIALLNRKSGVRILHFRRIKRLAVIANHKLHIVFMHTSLDAHLTFGAC